MATIRRKDFQLSGFEHVGDWSDEETHDPLYADDRNLYKVEKWARDGTAVYFMLATISKRRGTSLLKRSSIGHGSD
jgi:hypothetical protein